MSMDFSFPLGGNYPIEINGKLVGLVDDEGYGGTVTLPPLVAYGGFFIRSSAEQAREGTNVEVEEAVAHIPLGVPIEHSDTLTVTGLDERLDGEWAIRSIKTTPLYLRVICTRKNR